jgi:glyoxylase-like metal-dependent hydrolase (beta-lactamase superfamily II)
VTANSEPRLLRAGNPGPLTGDGNNTWLLDGAEPTLIDAGIGASNHLDAIAQALNGRALVRVLVTHGHPDHASGVPALRARWPALDVRQWQPNAETKSRALADGERVRAGDIDLVVVHTPGHAADHVCFWHEASRDLYTGDMAVKGSTVMIPFGRGGNLRDYLRSLEQLAALQPKRMLPGHGPIIEQPLELIAEYIKHRRAREAQVLQCLEDGVTDVDAIVARIYPDVSAPVRPAARLTVQAHLQKIREDKEI